MKIINLEQNTTEWLEFRKNKIGASDAVIIMGDSPWTTPLQLWERKLGFSLEQPESRAMSEGKRLESVAREAFEKEMSLNFPAMVGISDSHEWMMASFDGLNKRAAVEIKVPGEKDHTEACRGNIPKKYRYQLQHQLAVADLDMLYYYSFDAMRYRLDGEWQGIIIEVERDQEMIDKMIEEEIKFLKCLTTCTPPELSEKDYNLRHDKEWNFATRNWISANENLKLAEIQEKEMRHQLMEACHSMNSRGCGVKVQKIMRKGSVDYSKITELKEIDLEQYRKPVAESWRIILDD